MGDHQEDRRTDQETRDKVNKLYTLFYENGFREDMRKQADSLEKVEKLITGLQLDFKVFLAGRGATCPVSKSVVNDKRLKYAMIGAMTAIGASAVSVVGLLLAVVGVI